MGNYAKIIRVGNDFKPVEEIDLSSKLLPGVYELNQNRDGSIFFSSIKTNHDALIDLPNTEYDTVIKEIDVFMQPRTQQSFKDFGFVYKRSTLLYGVPGSGKTSIINRVINKVIKDNGVVLFSPNPKLLEEAFRALDTLQSTTRIMVVFEELDQLIENYESSLLNLLDGEIQKDNVIYMATTNFIDKIPARIRRPGRFSSVLQVGLPSASTRKFYLNTKLAQVLSAEEINAWTNKTNNFSIDELKETVLGVMCLGLNLDMLVDRIKENKGFTEMDPEKFIPTKSSEISSLMDFEKEDDSW